MKILILGASGKLGKSLVKNFISNKIYVLAHSNKNSIKFNNEYLTKINYDIFDKLDYFADKLNDVAIIINCIGESRDTSQMESINFLFVKKFIKLISKIILNKKIHWIQISSIGIYGNSLNDLINEESEPNPSNKYETTKLMAEKIIISESNSNSNFHYTILRPSIIYGPNIRNNIISFFFKISEFNFFLKISKCTTNCPFVDIREIVFIINQIVKNKLYYNNDFNISHNYSLIDIKLAIGKKLNKKLILLKINLYLALIFFYLGKIVTKKIHLEQLNFFLSQKIYSRKKVNTSFNQLPIHSLLDFLVEDNIK